MKIKNISDEELEKELEKSFKANEAKNDIFKILRGEKASNRLKEKRLKRKLKF